MPPLCVVFDIDDTLYLERDYVSSGLTAVGRWMSKWLGVAGFGELCMSLFAGGLRSGIFDEALSQSRIEPSPALIQTLVELYRTHAPSIELLSDVAEALPAIASRWPVAVLTDGPPSAQSAKARALGLPELADPIVLTGALGPGFEKPNTKGFLRVQNAIQARKFIYIADNPHKDFAGPRSLGWATVRVRRQGGLHYSAESGESLADIEIRDFACLVELLTQLARHDEARAAEQS